MVFLKRFRAKKREEKPRLQLQVANSIEWFGSLGSNKHGLLPCPVSAPTESLPNSLDLIYISHKLSLLTESVETYDRPYKADLFIFIFEMHYS